MLDGHRAIVESHDAFIAVRTPSNPGYFFGNYLLFDRAPRVGDADRWSAAFERIFAADANVRHAAFAWSIDDSPGAIDEFVSRGYTFQEAAVLTAREVQRFDAAPELVIRPLRSDADWDAQLALGLANREEQYEADAYARFKARQVAHHRHLAQTLGVWLGAFDGEQLAGSCGIFATEEGIARYQDVGVLPQYRNRGIARSLLGHAARYAAQYLRAQRFVIVADAHDFPRKLYERAGFTLQEREGALWIARR